MSANHGVAQYFTYKITNTYCVVRCSHCKHTALLWFRYKKNSDETITDITFFRPPYGLAMHRNVEEHV